MAQVPPDRSALQTSEDSALQGVPSGPFRADSASLSNPEWAIATPCHTPRMSAKRFTGEIYAGHTTDRGVIVPFDASKAWRSAPTLPIGRSKHVGYAVRGTANGEPFESWIFHYFKKWRIVVLGAAMKAAKLGPGDTAKFVVQPHPEPETAPKFKAGAKRRARWPRNHTAWRMAACSRSGVSRCGRSSSAPR